MRRLLPVAIVSMLLVAAGSAQGAPAVDGFFDLPDTPGHVALGPDGNVWVAISAGNPDFARVTPDGTVTPFTATDATISNVFGIAAGPDGNMWATMAGAVVKFSTADPTAAVKTDNGNIVQPQGITTGPDGNLWTASADKVFRFSPATPATPQFTTVSGMNARGITAGSDGNMYVADFGGSQIQKLTTAGVATPIAIGGGGPQEVAGGPNGQVAYSNPGANPEAIGLINGGVAATPLQFATPPDPFGVTLGQDGAYWFAQSNSDSLGRYATDGSYTTLPGLPAPATNLPRYIAKGANNTLWVTLVLGKKIARVSGVEPPDAVAPAISKLKLTNKTFKVGSKKTALVARKKKKTPTGTTIKYNLDEAATVTIAVEKAATGRKSGKNCVKPTAKLKKAKKCTRYVAYKEKLTRLQLTGPNKVAFSGRFGKTKLRAGKYRFSIVATDARGNASKPSTTKFTISTK